MIHMRAFIPANSPQKLNEILQWSKLRQEQVSQAILISKESVISFLKRQIEKGNWEAVREILKGKPMTKTGKFLVNQLRDHIATNLIMRLGLRKVIAVGIAMVVLPLILAKLSGDVINRFRNKSE